LKNITLITWLGEGNFGTCLQSYALNTELAKLGYKVSFLQSIPSRLGLYGWARWGKNTVVELINHYKYKDLQTKKRNNFQRKNFNILTINITYQLKQLIANTDCFITGSDQIWNTYVAFNPRMFLDFANDKKRVAYASSIGTNDVKEEYRESVKELLLKFNHIGVREKTAVAELSKLTGRNDIVQVLDPTFLLTPTDWNKMSKDAVFETEMPKNYILCYFIGNNTHYINQLSKVRNAFGNKNIVIIPADENRDFTFDGAFVYKNASPIEFVNLLQNADCVCTDSFHATALSINHSVPFVEFMRFKDDDSKSQNSRIYDLLEHYGLMDRIYDENNMSWTNDINYDRVQEILSADRKFSIDYLVNAIEN